MLAGSCASEFRTIEKQTAARAFLPSNRLRKNLDLQPDYNTHTHTHTRIMAIPGVPPILPIIVVPKQAFHAKPIIVRNFLVKLMHPARRAASIRLINVAPMLHLIFTLYYIVMQGRVGQDGEKAIFL